jgi:hypothetical protein
MSKTKAPDIRLSYVRTMAQIEQVIELLQPEDVWRNLEFEEPPVMVRSLKAEQVMGLWDARLIHILPSDSVIGCIILDTRKLKSDRSIELDIAISGSADRGQGLSTRAMALCFDEYLYGTKCDTVWGWIDVRNKASLAMVKTMGLPIRDEIRKDRHMADGPVESVDVVLTKEDWMRIRPKIAKALRLPTVPITNLVD